MGKTISEWEREIKELDSGKKEQFQKALECLLRWKAFEDEYGWTGLGTIERMLYWAGRGGN